MRRAAAKGALWACLLPLLLGAGRHRRPPRKVEPSAPVPFSCPEDRRVDVEPEAWRKALLEAGTWQDHNRLLVKLHMEPVWRDRPGEALPHCESITQVEGVELSPVSLTGAQAPDRLVQAWFDVCGAKALRAEVLRPMPEGGYCALGADALGVERDAASLPCGEGEDKRPRALSAVHLTDPGRATLEVKDRTGGCTGDGGGREQVSFYEVEGVRLVPVFSLVTRERLPARGKAPGAFVRRSLELSGDFPRTLTSEETIEEEGRSPRKGKRKVFAFKRGRYTER